MIKLVEVGPRDGLQNEKIMLSCATKVQFIEKLSQAGIKHIEAGAFVSPKWVPQMADSAKIFKQLKKSHKLVKATNLSALVPNLVGLDAAIDCGIKEIAIFAACSESFSQRNINCSIKESISRFQLVVKKAMKSKIRVRGYLSTSFGCPYEGRVPVVRVEKLIRKMLELGVYEVSIGDTIGVATPKQVRALLKRFSQDERQKLLAMHFHNTRGTGLANVLASLDLDITTYDSSLGGLGGCPYAKGASGNLPTEDLIYMLHGMGLKTGVNLKKLIEISWWMESKIKHPLPSFLSKANLNF
ncbi:MAG: hydroxymethylglutaryl-CoA lyase [Bdellovibrionaceae bacterium]|nr:hydroxymethylglutaryl-CoA lyase [Pseudobdellovibrionaceae bacterium]